MSPSQKILFIDIETIASASTYQELSPAMQEFWLKKAARLGATTRAEQEELFLDKGGIFAEFGQVVVIGLGWYTRPALGGSASLYVKALANRDEQALLQAFVQLLESFPEANPIFCGHNIKEFDLPYLCRRIVVNGLPLPAALDIQSKKPWEVKHLDTMELWKFGDRKSYTSLDLLATLLGVPSSKDDISGADVTRCYYQENGLARIKRYCIKDVIATAQVQRRLTQLPLLPSAAIKLEGEITQPIAQPNKSKLPLLDI